MFSDVRRRRVYADDCEDYKYLEGRTRQISRGALEARIGYLIEIPTYLTGI